MQTKLTIKGKLVKDYPNKDADVELKLKDLKSQHPELWLGEEEVKNKILNWYVKTKEDSVSRIEVDKLAKALAGATNGK